MCLYLLTLSALLFSGVAAANITQNLSQQEERMVATAKLFYAFWDTGDFRYAREALSHDFIDHTLPSGRPQRPGGPLYASEHFRKIVPDLRCRVDEILSAETGSLRA